VGRVSAAKFPALHWKLIQSGSSGGAGWNVGFALGSMFIIIMYESRPKDALNASSGLNGLQESTPFQSIEPAGNIGDPS
jgi:hypothetical protein